MDDEPKSDENGSIHSIYTNVCLTLITICLLILASTSIVNLIINNSGNSAGINKIAICDPENARCTKVNAGRRLETTN